MELVLSDFGVATWADPERRTSAEVVPLTLRSPELLLHAPWDHKVDIWAAGCIIYEMIENQRIFVGEGPCEHGWDYNAEFHLLEITEILGDFPQSLLATTPADVLEFAFDATGKMLLNRPDPCPPLQEWVRSLTGTSKELFLSMLQDMFTLDPTFRSSADLLQYSPWLDEVRHDNSHLHELASPLASPTTTSVDLDFANSTMDLDEIPGSPSTVGSSFDGSEDFCVADNSTQSWRLADKTCGTSTTFDYNRHNVERDGLEDHIRKKVKLAPVVTALESGHEFADVSMDDQGSSHCRHRNSSDLDYYPSSCEDLPVLQAAPDMPSPDETAASLQVKSTSTDPASFLNASDHSVVPPSRGVKVLGNASRADLVCGAIWFCKEVVVGFFSLLG